MNKYLKLIFLLFVCMSRWDLIYGSNDEPIFSIVLDSKAKQFKSDKLKQIGINEDDVINEYLYKDKNGSSVRITYSNNDSWNGVVLLDNNGNTLSSLENSLYTSKGRGPSCGVWDVVSGDMNGDKKKDYYIQLRCTGNGLAQTSQCILFLSGQDKYKELHFDTYQSDSKHLMNLYNDGRCFLIVEDIIYCDITLPPLDKEEFPFEETKESLGMDTDEDVFSYYRHMQPLFHIYYPLEITGQELHEYVDNDKRFPMFVSYYKGEQWYGKVATKLLTPKQKIEIWNSNPMGYADVKIRYKEFMK